MKKSLHIAIVVEAVVLVIAFVFSVMCFQFGIGRENLLLNIGLVIIWLFVAGVMLLVFWWRSIVREEMVRRFFVSDEWIYNHEIGYAPMKRVSREGDAYGLVTFAADALAKMSYGFEVAEVPDDFKPSLLISSRVFRYHFSGGDREMGDEPDGVVVDEWIGTLYRIDGAPDDESGYAELGRFENARELARLLEDSYALASETREEGE